MSCTLLQITFHYLKVGRLTLTRMMVFTLSVFDTISDCSTGFPPKTGRRRKLFYSS